MKLTKVALFLVYAILGANAGKFDNWSLEDVSYFLADRGVHVDNDNHDREQLIALAEEEYAFLKKEHSSGNSWIDNERVQHVLQFVTGSHKLPSKWDFLDFEDSNEVSVKDWVFDSWSKTHLKSFLDLNKIKYDGLANKADLVLAAKQNFEKISKNFQLSGLYPGSWVYSSWSVDDLKDWLSNNGISYDASETRDELVAKAKEYNYLASVELQDAKKSLFDSLLLGEKEIFNKGNTIKKDFINTWSYSQLREWLYYEGLIDTKPGVYVEGLDKADLQKIVTANLKYLATDIKTWADKAAKLASPILEKGAETVLDAADVINDTFLIGVDKWDQSRLKQFLNSRSIAIPLFSTHAHLVKLVQENVNKPLAKGISDDNGGLGEWFLENLSTETIQEWLKKNGQDSTGLTRKKLISKLEEYVSSGKQLNEKVQTQVSDEINKYKPNLDDYRTYLGNIVENASKFAADKLSSAKDASTDAAAEIKAVTEENIRSSYQVGEEYYSSAATALAEKYAHDTKQLNKALNEAKLAANQYAAKFATNVEQGHAQVKESVALAQKNGLDYANSIFAPKVPIHSQFKQNFVVQPWEYIKQYVSVFFKGSNKPTTSVNGITSGVQQFYDQAIEIANKIASDAQSVVQSTIEPKSTGFVEYASTAFNDATNQWSSFWNSLLDADAKAYLRSFGYSQKFLDNITQDQLYRLVQQQTDFYFGSTVWDKSISEIIDSVIGTQKTPLEKIREAISG